MALAPIKDNFYNFFYVASIYCFVTGTAAMEKEIAEYILSLGKIPIGWEEALFKSNVVSILPAYW